MIEVLRGVGSHNTRCPVCLHPGWAHSTATLPRVEQITCIGDKCSCELRYDVRRFMRLVQADDER